jgi:hypothetical protein
MQLIERDYGHNNQMMYESCLRLQRVINISTTETKRGKIEIKLKHKTDIETVNKINMSCEHYRLLSERDLKRHSELILRDYQIDITNKAIDIINRHGFVYLAMEVRTGKTFTSLSIAEDLMVKNVLFITKKKAISGIKKDINHFLPIYNIEVINYESLHTVENNHIWDLVICDEAHSMGAFPKPSIRAVSVKNILKKTGCKTIFLSGTPTPESYSQIYHQVYGVALNPFRGFSNFYKFANEYVNVVQRNIAGNKVNDYSNALKSIIDVMNPYTISYTQKEAGFLSEIKEEILYIKLKESTYNIINKLKKDLVVKGKDEVILADTSVKLMTKIHQLCSGTVKFESGNSIVLDTSKAEFIKNNFLGCKIGIFYKFKEELNALEEIFGDELTTDLEEFDNTNKNIALQIVSGREGISLKNADYLVYYNIDFSATSYWQSKDRMTTKERPANQVYWIFSIGGIEKDIYKQVLNKKDYTLNHFKESL